MTPRLSIAAFVVALALSGAQAFAQANVPFGGLAHDASLPVQISADSLTVNQSTGDATFSGNVVVGQGTLRLAANRITVFYGVSGGTTGEVSRMEASGGVTLTNGAEAAEADVATYDVVSGVVSMSGDVLLTQGANALSGQTLNIDLNTGTAQMEGRVQTILQPQTGQ